MHKKPKISLIICTHNRDSILELSLKKNVVLLSNEHLELILVLNGCTDNSKNIALNFQKGYDNFRIVEESSIGLSKARNKGAHAANADWIFYVDDDAHLPFSSLEPMLEIIKTQKLWAFSGRVLYWPINSPSWIRSEFIESPLYAETRSTITLPAFMHGCAMGINKQKLLALGGFSQALGMRAKKIAYAEEIELQMRIEKAGGIIQFDPEIEVFHQSHFKTVSQFLHSYFKKGQYVQKINPHFKWKHLVKGIIFFLIAVVSVIINSFKFGYKAAIVKSFSQASYEFGRVF